MKTYKQEINGEGQHRIVCSDGRVTGWARHVEIAFMDGWVSCVAWAEDMKGLYPMDQYLRLVAIL